MKKNMVTGMNHNSNRNSEKECEGCTLRKKKANKAIFVGYPHRTKVYKLHDLDRKCFVVIRFVTFLEKKFHKFDE